MENNKHRDLHYLYDRLEFVAFNTEKLEEYEGCPKIAKTSGVIQWIEDKGGWWNLYQQEFNKFAFK